MPGLYAVEEHAAADDGRPGQSSSPVPTEWEDGPAGTAGARLIRQSRRNEHSASYTGPCVWCRCGLVEVQW